MDKNNCQKKIPDCFHPKGLKQIGVNPYTQSPTESEVAFDNRYTKVGGRKIRRRRLLKGGRGSVNTSPPASYTFDLSKECQFAEVSPLTQECGSKVVKMEGGRKGKTKRRTVSKKLRRLRKKSKVSKKK